MRKNQALYILSFLIIISGILAFSKQTSAASPWINIDGGKSATNKRQVSLVISGIDNVKEMVICNKSDFVGCYWENFQTYKLWELDYGAGNKVVYIKFRDKNGYTSGIYTDSITLSVPSAMSVDFNFAGFSTNTTTRSVVLELTYSLGVESVSISNTKDFKEYQNFPVSSKITWLLSPKSGKKTVYVSFNDVNNKSKVISKTITYTQPERYLPEGSLLKGKSSTIYYLGFDGLLHPFPNVAFYHSWYKDFSQVNFVGNGKIAEYNIGEPVCMRPGTWLVKFKYSSKIYNVEHGCVLRPVLSEAGAYILFGKGWENRIIELDAAQASYFDIKSYSVNDLGKGIIDKDSDGVDKNTEESYGTSDKKNDSDKDGLSDYEEIYYWFSDPSNPDSDGDGKKDGEEILNNNSPVGFGKLTEIPAGTYPIPSGLLMYKPGATSKEKTLYYSGSDKKLYSISVNKNVNNFYYSDLFIAKPPFKMTLPKNGSGSFNQTDSEFTRPTTLVNDKVIIL